MAKALKINLKSQREIQQEGVKETPAAPAIPVGRVKTGFFVPELNLDPAQDSPQKGSPQVQKVIERINQYIENIADDYFLLGLHLISLHKLLKESRLTTEQIKSWYAENINMPYSSAMQCKKVAEVYSPNPELIGRYTASGAYLLTACKTPQEREAVWEEARGDKPAPSIRELRETLKSVRERQALEHSPVEKVKTEDELPKQEYRMTPKQIRQSFRKISTYCENFVNCKNAQEQIEMRKSLLETVRDFLKKMEEPAHTD